MGEDSYQVAILGGALAGSSLALLLRRRLPGCRILVVERKEGFDHKVGEATVEVSARFLDHVLGLGDLLREEHLPKHGLRFWFADRPDRSLGEMSEAGPASAPPVPAFQLDRSRLDERVLERAAAEGVEVVRPGKVADLELRWPESRLRIETPDGERRVRARWVLDATGRHALIARRLKLLERIEAHPTAAAWGRWEGVLDPDAPGATSGGDDPPRLAASRRLATNHFCGDGWWCWMIPLAGGRTSIGLVWDRTLFELPREGSLADSYRRFLTRRAGLRDLLREARMVPEDFRAYGNLAYRSRRYMDRGWALVGDAASFIDPYYSPGLDHLAISVYATARLVGRELGGELEGDELGRAIEGHNERFARSYERWIEALYLGKYRLLGDAELTVASYLLETSLYYLGVVDPVYRDDEALGNPILGLRRRGASVAFTVLRGIGRRLQTLAGWRRRHGTFGRRNVGWRRYSPPFDLGPTGVARQLAQGLRLWAGVELGVLRDRLLHRRGPLPPAPHPDRAS